MDRKNIGHNLRVLRKQSGMTQSDLAEDIGVSKDHISHAEIGVGSISMPLLLEICRALNVTPNDVLSGEYEMEEENGQDLKDVSLSLGDIDSPKDRMILYDLYTSMARKQKR
jgi:Predicted transcriptional regulators